MSPAHASQNDPVDQSSDCLTSECLTFLLAGETFAVDILCIKEIIEFRRLTIVPMMPEAVRGVINLRGAVVPVIDLQARFGRASTEVGKRTCIVIVEIGAGSKDLATPDATASGTAPALISMAPPGSRGTQAAQVIGLLVDAVNEVIDIAAGSLAPPPAFGARMRPEFIRGIAKVDTHFVIVLDVDRVLALDDLQSLSQDASPVAT